MDDPACYQGNRMTQVKTLLDSLRPQVTARVEQERAALLDDLAARWAQLAARPEFSKLTPAQVAALRQPFDTLQRTLARQSLIAVLRDTLRRFDEIQAPSVLRQIDTWSNEAPPPVEYPAPGDGDTRTNPPVIAQQSIRYVTQAELSVRFDKNELADEQDVERYLAALKRAYLQAIGAGKRVKIP